MQIYFLENHKAVDSSPKSTATEHGSTNLWSHHVKEVLLTASFLQHGIVSILMSATMQPVHNWWRGLSIPHDALACCPRARGLVHKLSFAALRRLWPWHQRCDWKVQPRGALVIPTSLQACSSMHK